MRMMCLIAMILISLSAVSRSRERVIVVKKGSVESLLSAIAKANKMNADSLSPRLHIILPAATYDLGKLTLTRLSANNVSIVGEGMTRTIIMNAPDVKDEGISKTATLLITGQNTYLQDLTLQNAMNYYASDKAGRAVCIQDLGTRTICKRVRLLSYQDTYYTKNELGDYYWEDSEIHGTVDFICGRGEVMFENCNIVIEKRNANGTGHCVISAPHSSRRFGHFFHNCTIKNLAESYSLARSWNGKACAYYVNTTLEDPKRLDHDRFTRQGMRVVPTAFVECNSMDVRGVCVSPESNVLTFFKDSIRKTMETIDAPSHSHRYSAAETFPDWRPDIRIKQLERDAKAAFCAKIGCTFPKESAENVPTFGVDGNLPASYQKMKQSLSFPLSWANNKEKDFNVWHESARSKLKECLSPAPPAADFDVRLIESETRDGYIASKIAFNVSAYDRIPAYLLTPTTGKGPFPAIVILHDHGATFSIGKEKNVMPLRSEWDKTLTEYGNKRNQKGQREPQKHRLKDFTDRWISTCYDSVYIGDWLAQQGYVVLCADALYWGERSRRQGSNYDVMDAFAGNLEQLGYTWAGLIANDDISTLQMAKSLPQVDASRVGVVGFSMGARRAWTLAALEDDVKACAAVSWLATTDSLITPRNNQTRGGGWSLNVHGLANFMDIPDVASLVCPRPLLLFSGRSDALFPAESVQQAFNSLRNVWESQQQTDNLQTELWQGRHFFSREMQQKVLQFLNKHLK